MLFRKSISTTKKLFQKTLNNFKSLFSSDSYQRIPKTSNNPYSYNDMSRTVHSSFNNNKDLDKFYHEFSDRWDNSDQNIKPKATKTTNNVTVTPPQPPVAAVAEPKQEMDGEFKKFTKASSNSRNKMKGLTRFQEYNKRDHEERSFLVAQKLKELEMIDMSNVDHVLDIEEVLHYYSRLTCPVYLDIVDKFFMEMYAEFLNPPPAYSTPRSVHSRPLRPSLLRS
ncbi:uncharacterized protein LOC126669452 [Mercurialis annua]|uniref:uncharacterized protein LOC126669452 n=1 Tax=Mercurialis annua TaxID=3986 RepID=UPI002160703A|nr:uncharacterized protein LOC126669452 [Mercurialis annua]